MKKRWSAFDHLFYLGLAYKLRMLMFRRTPPISIPFDLPAKIIATLWFNFQVQRTGNIYRI